MAKKRQKSIKFIVKVVVDLVHLTKAGIVSLRTRSFRLEQKYVVDTLPVFEFTYDCSIVQVIGKFAFHDFEITRPLGTLNRTMPSMIRSASSGRPTRIT